MIFDAHGREAAQTLVDSSNGRFNDRALEILKGFETELKQIKVGAGAERANGFGLQALVDGVTSGPHGGIFAQNTMNFPGTAYVSSGGGLMTLNRVLLSQEYIHQGLVRKVIDMPVHDAFRGGVRFKSGQLNDEQIDELNREFAKPRDQLTGKAAEINRGYNNAAVDVEGSDLGATVAQGIWSRLFGGGGLVINTNQPFASKLRVDAIGKDSPLQFIAADRWELTLQNLNLNDPENVRPYFYYGLNLNRTRVIKLNWDPAPSFFRRMLQGWGMSVLEHATRGINIFLKYENLLFELLDEAKTDVFKIKGYNTSLATDRGTDLVRRRVALNNQMKNFQSALTMDFEDDYVQKQLSFSGLPEIWDRIALTLCSYLGIPFNKLFGESAGGFSSGEDALDNYNVMVEGVRERINPVTLRAGALRCQQLFGMIPDDLETEYAPLSVLDGVQEETVKKSQHDRLAVDLQNGTLSGQEYAESQKKLGLLYVDTAVLRGEVEAVPALSVNPDEMAANQEHDLALTKAAAAAKPKPGTKKK